MVLHPREDLSRSSIVNSVVNRCLPDRYLSFRSIAKCPRVRPCLRSHKVVDRWGRLSPIDVTILGDTLTAVRGTCPILRSDGDVPAQ